MSALTDLFSAMATKIRSKTGTATTYTPPEMVSDGIDDVYEAGVAAGTPTLTGDASASDVKSGKTFYGSTLTKQTGTFAADTTNNSATATTSQATKTPASGKYFADFTVNPQQHSETYTPSANTAANDMGAVHNKRYVNTSGMIVPSGNKAITANGTGIDVSSYATASVAVPDPTLTGDAAVGNVLSGKTFYNDSLTKQTGTMTNRGAWTSTGNNCNASTTKDVTIPAGYHNGSGYVRFNSLSSQTGVDTGKTAVVAGAMLSGYQGWVNGSKISGNISSKAAATYNTSASDQTITSGQYLSGTQTIKAVTTSGITAANIKDGAVVKVGDSNSATRIANVTGTFTDAATVSSGQTAAAAAQIKSGYSAWVDGAEVKGTYTEPTLSGDAAVSNVLYGKTFYNNSYTRQTGTMANNGDGSATLNCGESKVLSAGYYSGGTISANSLSSQTGVDSGKTAVTAAKMFSGYQGWVNGNKISGTYTAPTITDIAPSDLSPVSLATTGNYHPTSAGYAIASNLTALAPSNSNPAPINASKVYKPTDSGYAIGVYEEKTPSASGVAFSAGMVKMSSAGYAYSEKPTETTLWTNTSPTSTFANQDITLTQSMGNFDYLKIKFATSKSYTSDSYCAEAIVSVEDMRRSTTTTYAPQTIVSSRSTSGGQYVRRFLYSSETVISVSSGQQIAGTSGNNNYVIPISIKGLKSHPYS